MQKTKELTEQLSVKTSETKSTIHDDQIFVGGKDFMNYVRSAEILFRNKSLKVVTIRARGKNISKAVDLAESVKNKFCADLNIIISKITSSTEKFESEGREFSVSILEIVMKR